MGKKKRSMSVALAVSMFCSILGGFGLETKAQEPAAEKAYVIIAENDKIYEEVAEEIDTDITVETPVLSENNVLIADLTEGEAKILSEREDVLIEEDIVLSGSTIKGESGNAYTMFERKEALKRKKEQQDFIDMAQCWSDREHLPFVFGRLCVRGHYGFFIKMIQSFQKKSIRIPHYWLMKYSYKTGVSKKDILEYLKFCFSV